MKINSQKGMSLLELLVALTITGLVAGAAAPLISSSLDAYDKNDAKSSLYQEGLIAMERMTSGVRSCTYFLIPNAPNTTRDILAFSGTYNDDDDYYFGDTLFPRIDEDTGTDMSNDSRAGIKDVDDNGNSFIDEGASGAKVDDDDEDGTADEESLNGLDDDGDGNIDEDLGLDAKKDEKPGIAGIDDDGDGVVDELVGGVDNKDNDEDGAHGEDPLNPVMYQFVSGSNTLKEIVPHLGVTVVLSTHVTQFQVTSGVSECIRINMTLTGDDGETVTFTEYVYPRNRLQKTGKRVR